MNWRAIRAIYVYEMSRTFRTLIQSLVAPVISTSLYFVVFGTAIGSRIDTRRGRRLRRLHRPRPDHADRADAVDLQRLLRHLLPEVHRHDLRAALRADLLSRDRHRLRRRRRHQVLHHRPRHLRHRAPLRDAAGPPPRGDARLSGAHLPQLQPLRLHHRHLGEELRAAPAGAAARHLAAGLPRRQLLLDHHAAAALAEDHPVQPGGLPDLRLPLGLLRHRRRRRRPQPRRDRALHADLPRCIVWWIFRTGYRIRT